MGRKAKYRNAADKQKAYRERKKREEMQTQQKQERYEKELSDKVRELGLVKWSWVYADMIIPPKPGHVSCPCGNKQIPDVGRVDLSQLRGCPKRPKYS